MATWKERILPGYVFFTSYAHGDLVAEGIGYFQRRSRRGPVAVVHTGIALNNWELIESHWQTGVRYGSFAKYRNDANCRVYYRRPAGYSACLGRDIAQAAESRAGAGYDKGLIFSQLASNTFVGHWLNVIFRGRPEAWLSRKMDRRQQFICSELVAWALAQQPLLQGRGVLRQPLNTISPQELFEDSTLWEPEMGN